MGRATARATELAGRLRSRFCSALFVCGSHGPGDNRGLYGLLARLVAAAVNAALATARQSAQDELQRLQASLGLPAMPGMGGAS